jgi:hypothetical protein
LSRKLSFDVESISPTCNSTKISWCKVPWNTHASRCNQPAQESTVGRVQSHITGR